MHFAAIANVEKQVSADCRFIVMKERRKEEGENCFQCTYQSVYVFLWVMFDLKHYT